MKIHVTPNPSLGLSVSGQTDAAIGVSASGGEVKASAGSGVKVVQISGGETYAGPYACTPQNYSQTFGTAKKYMAADFLVHTVPTREDRNEAGGVTLTIGG